MTTDMVINQKNEIQPRYRSPQTDYLLLLPETPGWAIIKTRCLLLINNVYQW